jgi:hypothetical protein
MAMTGSRSPGEGAALVGTPKQPVAGPGPAILAASTLAGNAVVNTQGEDLGKITEIMIDVTGGWIAYAVLSSGGLLGIGDKLHAIPWAALLLDVERQRFVLDVDAERLKQAPGFDKEHWPTMADLRWANEVHAFYGQRRYWQPPDNQTQTPWSPPAE